MQSSISLPLAGVLFASLATAGGAIVFSGSGDDNDLTLTVTEDIFITLDRPLPDNYLAFNLDGVYAPGSITPVTANAVPPSTPYATGITVDLVSASGGVASAVTYDVWGTLSSSLGDYDTQDFFGMFVFASAPETAAGDTIVIRAGTVLFPGHPINGMPAPDFEVTTIQLLSSQGEALSAPQAIPEPQAWLMGGAAAVAMVLHRRNPRAAQ